MSLAHSRKSVATGWINNQINNWIDDELNFSNLEGLGEGMHIFQVIIINVVVAATILDNRWVKALFSGKSLQYTHFALLASGKSICVDH